MAIKKISEDIEAGTRTIAVSNGDLIALKEITERWNFKDIETALRFAVAVMVQAENKKIYIDTDGESKVTIKPTEVMLKDNEGAK